MEITYTLTQNDFYEALKYIRFKIKTNLIDYLQALFCQTLAIMIAVVLIVHDKLRHFTLIQVGLDVIAFVFVVWFLYVTCLQILKRQAQNQIKQSNPGDLTVTLKISPEDYTISYASGSHVTKWSAAHQLVETGTYFIVLNQKQVACLIPSNAFDSAESALEFKALVTKYLVSNTTF